MKSLFKLWSKRIRLWRYFRDGYSIYVTKPLTIVNFLTVTYYLLLERIPTLQFLFPRFHIYAIAAFVLVVPLSVLFGWWHMRKALVYGKESILAVESNPQTAFLQRVSMENAKRMYDKLGIPLTKEWLDLLDYWTRLDEQMKWKP